jgi:hypothetical protein
MRVPLEWSNGTQPKSTRRALIFLPLRLWWIARQSHDKALKIPDFYIGTIRHPHRLLDGFFVVGEFRNLRNASEVTVWADSENAILLWHCCSPLPGRGALQYICSRVELREIEHFRNDTASQFIRIRKSPSVAGLSQ